MDVGTKRVSAAWLEANYPCRQACPVNTEAGRYVHHIAAGEFDAAYRLARLPNPFASICGRICAAPCEDACRRGGIDQPLAIRALKRFVCERYGVESRIDLERLRTVAGQSLQRNDRRIAVVGAGPAGLSAAHDLSLLGYSVTIFEAQPVAGGMLRLGIPEYRLPRELVRLEVNAILSLGAELRLEERLGDTFELDDLEAQGFEAVFLGIGAHRSRDLRIEGVDGDGVLNAIDFLLNANLGYRFELGASVLVIGGGNVAVDVARTAARQSPVEHGPISDITEALDVARSAVRFGARHVEMVCLESRDEMPAARQEITEATEEGIRIHTRRAPKRVLRDAHGRVTGLETLDVASVFDANGRFDPTLIPNTEKVVAADTVIVAIGQTADLSFLRHGSGIEVSPRGVIQVEPRTLATTRPGVYAGGDVAFGPRIAIEAVADGRRAAAAIDAYLFGRQPPGRSYAITVHDTDVFAPPPRYEKIARQPIPALPLERRIGIAQVEVGYDETQAVAEASRCLRCWINTIFEGEETTGSECILCGGCVDICPEDCLAILSLEGVAVPPDVARQLGAEAGLDASDIEALAAGALPGAIMLKNEERCIRCGLCAKRCPVDCITMEGFSVREEVASHGG